MPNPRPGTTANGTPEATMMLAPPPLRRRMRFSLAAVLCLALCGCGADVPAETTDASHGMAAGGANGAGVDAAIGARGAAATSTSVNESDASVGRAEVADALRDRMTGPDGGRLSFSDVEVPEGVEDAVHALYERRRFESAWLSGRSIGSAGARLLEALEASHREGLDPERYHVSRIAELRERLDGGTDDPAARRDMMARLDLLLTGAFALHARDLARGMLDGGDANWRMDADEVDLEALLSDAAGSDAAVSLLDGLRPRSPRYERLVDALARHRSWADEGGWPPLIPGAGQDTRLLREGDRDRVVALLRVRLGADEEGRMWNLRQPERRVDGGQASPRDSEAPGDITEFDETLADALRHFQERHGLLADGILGPGTLEALNVPVEARIRAIELNLERWRWVPRDFEDRHVFVNVPGFRLEVMENGENVLDMRVVVGEPAWQTPSFRDRISYLVLNPYWYVPASIADREIFPRAEEDEDYLARNEYEETGLSSAPLRQRPGGGNPMGGVKFMFPNPFNIYLHDTPSYAHFDRSSRAFSHGCIRLEEPWRLAEYLLGDDPEWDAEGMEAVVGGGREVEVALPETVPIYIVYFTAEVGENDVARFHGDLYGRDRALNARWEALAPAAAGVAAAR